MLLALLYVDVWLERSCGCDDVDESRMLGVRLCFDGFVGVYVVDEVVVDRRMLVACCLN